MEHGRVDLVRGVVRVAATVARAAWWTVWLVAVPGLVAVLAVRALEVGALPAALAPALDRLRTQPLLGFALVLVAVAAAVAHWRFHLPGAAWAHRAPLRAPSGAVRVWASAERRLRERALPAAAAASLRAAQAELRAAPAAKGAREALERALAAAPAGAGPGRAKGWGSLVLSIAAAVVLALATRAFAAAPANVASSSMVPTLWPGDTLAVLPEATARAFGPPRRGDVVLFELPRVQGGLVVKRVVGVGGDRVAMNGAHPVVNGMELPWCDVGELAYVDDRPRRTRVILEWVDGVAYLVAFGLRVRPPVDFPPEGYAVPPGEVFVLGDNRENSVDSRAWNGGRGGSVPAAALAGRARLWLYTKRDFAGRFLRPVAGPRATTPELREGVARCLADRPAHTSPPPPPGAR